MDLKSIPGKAILDDTERAALQFDMQGELPSAEVDQTPDAMFELERAVRDRILDKFSLLNELKGEGFTEQNSLDIRRLRRHTDTLSHMNGEIISWFLDHTFPRSRQ